jgi:hypothetical protein
VWVTLGLAFSVFVYFGYEHHWLGLGAIPDAVDDQVNDGGSAAVKYLTGYVIEKSLSVDNIFVIAMISDFSRFRRSISTGCSSGHPGCVGDAWGHDRHRCDMYRVGPLEQECRAAVHPPARQIEAEVRRCPYRR